MTSQHWSSAVKSSLLMLVIYVALDAVAVRLGWITRIGWGGAVAASIVLGWFGYRRSMRSSELRRDGPSSSST